MDSKPASSTYELKDELAWLSLPAAGRDANLKLAWTNSVCLLFLIIGIAGAKRGEIFIKPAPPIEEIIPVVVEPLTLPPQETAEPKPKADDEKNDAPRVAVTIPTAPNISFSVPTIGALVVPANLASAPPLEPLRVAVQIGSVNSTGAGGERPQPPYPPIARETGEQGTVVVLLGGDAAGNIVFVEVKQSSGFPVLDRATVDFLKRHWHLPTNPASRRFQTSITYQLQF